VSGMNCHPSLRKGILSGLPPPPHARHACAVQDRIPTAAGEVSRDFVDPVEEFAPVATDLLRIDEVGHAEALAPRLAVLVDVDPDDMSAPASRSPWMTLRPMPPSPNTMQLSPASTLAVLSTAPMPVVTPQPM